MSSSFLSVADGLAKGTVTGILPGFHPLLLSFSSSISVSIAYGVYSVLSILPAVLVGAYSADSAFASVGDRKDVRYYIYGIVFGAALFLVFLPLWGYLSLRPPRALVATVLVFLSTLTIALSRNWKGAVLVAALSGILGYVSLKTAVGVSFPLIWLVMGLYGLSGTVYLFIGGEVETRGGGGDWLRGAVLGFVAGAAVAYFPSVSLSLVLFLLSPFQRLTGAGVFSAVGSGTASSLLLSVSSAQGGMIRTAFASQLHSFAYELVIPYFLFGLAVGTGLFYILLPFVGHVTHRLLAGSSLVLLPATALLISGPAGLCLLLAAASVGVLARTLNVEHRVLMFSLLVPTLTYYL